MVAPSISGLPTHASYWTPGVDGGESRSLEAFRLARFLDANRLTTLLENTLVHEFGAEFASDPPGQAALAGMTRRQNDGEFSGNFGVLGNDLHAAL
jgi:hypothetical protein